MSGFGVENTLLNWSNNMVHISVLLSVNRWVTGCNNSLCTYAKFYGISEKEGDHF